MPRVPCGTAGTAGHPPQGLTNAFFPFASHSVYLRRREKDGLGQGRSKERKVAREQEEKIGGTGTGRDTRERGQGTLEGWGSWARGQGQ